MSASWSVLIILLSVKIVYSDDIERDIKLRFYHGSFINYTELPIQRAVEIMSTSWYKKNRETVFYTHGFKGIPTGPAVSAVINTYLKMDCNIALLNWELLAGEMQGSLPDSYFNWVAPNGRMVGVRFADTLVDLIKAGVDLNNTHLVGHSLGAQVFGITGNTLAARGIRIQRQDCLLVPTKYDTNNLLKIEGTNWTNHRGDPWGIPVSFSEHLKADHDDNDDEDSNRITGLDPTHFGFDTKPPSLRLHPGSAVFVAAIHTDPDKYGMAKPMGTVDFWPNFKAVGVVVQPGCRDGGRPEILSADNKCSHDRSWQLFIEALNYPGSILGSYAINYKVWKHYRKQERLAVVLDIGSYHPNIVPGNYYFSTKAASPFGLGINGL